MVSPWYYPLAIKQYIGCITALHTRDEVNMQNKGQSACYLLFGPTIQFF